MTTSKKSLLTSRNATTSKRDNQGLKILVSAVQFRPQPPLSGNGINTPYGRRIIEVFHFSPQKSPKILEFHNLGRIILPWHPAQQSIVWHPTQWPAARAVPISILFVSCSVGYLLHVGRHPKTTDLPFHIVSDRDILSKCAMALHPSDITSFGSFAMAVIAFFIMPKRTARWKKARNVVVALFTLVGVGFFVVSFFSKDTGTSLVAATETDSPIIEAHGSNQTINANSGNNNSQNPTVNVFGGNNQIGGTGNSFAAGLPSQTLDAKSSVPLQSSLIFTNLDDATIIFSVAATNSEWTKTVTLLKGQWAEVSTYPTTSTNGMWSVNPALGPSKITGYSTNPAGPNYVLPSAPLGALVMQAGDGVRSFFTNSSILGETQIVKTPGDITFKANDLTVRDSSGKPWAFNDNWGKVAVEITIKAANTNGL